MSAHDRYLECPQDWTCPHCGRDHESKPEMIACDCDEPDWDMMGDEKRISEREDW